MATLRGWASNRGKSLQMGGHRPMALRCFDMDIQSRQSLIRVATWNMNLVCDNLLPPTVLSVLLQYDVSFNEPTMALDIQVVIPRFRIPSASVAHKKQKWCVLALETSLEC